MQNEAWRKKNGADKKQDASISSDVKNKNFA